MIGVDTAVDPVNRRSAATVPNERWCTDITEHPARDGTVYCCAILDCFSRMSIDNGNPSETTILHADHGTQFTSWSFGENMWRRRMQVELLNTRRWATAIELAAVMADYIDNYYNVERQFTVKLFIRSRSRTGTSR